MIRRVGVSKSGYAGLLRITNGRIDAAVIARRIWDGCACGERRANDERPRQGRAFRLPDTTPWRWCVSNTCHHEPSADCEWVDIAQTVPLMKSALSTGRRPSRRYDSSAAASGAVLSPASARPTPPPPVTLISATNLSTPEVFMTSNVSGWKRRSAAVTRASSVISMTVKSSLLQGASPICNSTLRHFSANCSVNDARAIAERYAALCFQRLWMC